jgi:hypothetical protein
VACLRQEADQARVGGHRVYGHTRYGIDEISVYPLFPDELIEVMRKVLPAEHQRHLVTAEVLRARKGSAVRRFLRFVRPGRPATVRLAVM